MKKIKLFILAFILMFTLSIRVSALELVKAIEDLTKTYEVGEELKLEADITLTKHTGIKNVTLDLNGHIINTSGYVLVTSGDVTIKDSSSDNTGKILNNTNAAIQQVQSSGNFVFESGTIEAKNGIGIYVNGGETTVNGGNISSDQNYSVIVRANSTFKMNVGRISYDGTNQAINMLSGASVIINDGEILAPNGRGVAAFKDTYFEMNGGKIQSKIQALTGNGSLSGANEGTNAKFKITGGVLESTNGVAIYAPQPQGETTITGGTLKGVTGIEIRAGKLNITNGEIISSYIPTESEKNGNGSTTKGAAVAVVQHTTKQPIDVIISDGYFEAYTPFIQENVQENEQEAIDKINIKIEGGVFKTIQGDENNQPTASVYSENKENFITGGAFSKKPELKYLGENLNSFEIEDYFHVIDNIIFGDEETPVALLSSEAFPKDYKLEILEIKDDALKEATKKVEDKFKSNEKAKDTKLLALYDINMKSDSGIVELNDKKFLIYVEMDRDLMKYENYKVLYFDKNGDIKEELDAELATKILDIELEQDNILVFETTHLSTYGVVGYNNTKVVGETNPATFDKSISYIIIGIISFCLVCLLIKTLKKQYNKV